MKNGILGEDEGYDVLVNGTIRTFSDDEAGSFEIARELKKRNPSCIVEIRLRRTGARVVMGKDGRIL